MHIMKVSLITILLAVTFTLTSAQRQVCGDVMVWRNDNATCPPNAVCADVFDTTRDWHNGTTCRERRVISNCLCDQNTLCPVNNDAHKLYVTHQQTSYTCQPRCTLPWCFNVERQRAEEEIRRGRAFRSRSRVYSMTNVQYSDTFDGEIFERMNCRCPRHHHPVSADRPGVHRAVRSWTRRYDHATSEFKIFFICDNRGDQPVNHEDPCPN